TSEITGVPGELIIDGGGFDLGLTTVSEGTNAKVFFGAEDPADAIVVERPSNQLTDIVEGVTIDLLSADVTESVTVTVARDFPTISGQISEFVEAFNAVVGRIDELDFYDVDSETRGILLGHPTPRAVKTALYQLVNSKATGLDTQFSYLSEVGITTGSEGTLEFDSSKFQEAYEEAPDAVEALFTAFDVTTTSTRELAPGVTITETQETINELGFGDLFDRLLDRLTNSVDGTVTTANNTIQDQIDRTNDQIEDFDLRLESKREVLERQFVAMEQALARLQGQNDALLSLLGNVSVAQGLVGG
ncbi:MAG: flagellar filament capping protein FliD, partial [Planctomycetota bacterium]